MVVQVVSRAVNVRVPGARALAAARNSLTSVVDAVDRVDDLTRHAEQLVRGAWYVLGLFAFAGLLIVGVAVKALLS